MPHTNPVGRPVDRSKDHAILAAARELFFGQGPQAVTMEAVAARAGVAKATVYARHASREDLVRAVVVEQCALFDDHLTNELDTLADVRAALERFCRRLLAFLTSAEHRMLTRTVGATPALPASLLREIYRAGPQATQDSLAHWLDAAARAGLIACPVPLQSAELLLGMLSGLELVRGIYREPSRRDHEPARGEYVGLVVDAFLRAHAAEGRQASREKK